jgi:hypothetical protein
LPPTLPPATPIKLQPAPPALLVTPPQPPQSPPTLLPPPRNVIGSTDAFRSTFGQ